MKKSFNVNGLCYPDEHYMVDLAGRLKQIKVLVEQQKYFIINRARQYGKTTVLWALIQYLQQEYTVISLSFQRMSTADFKDEHTFVSAFANAFVQVVNNKKKNVTGLNQASIEALQSLADNDRAGLRTLFERLSMICAAAQKPLVLMIDEVDSASNNQVFLDFLAQLRDYYLDRRQTPTFHSVILAGVYDIKNLKQKIRPDEEHRYNSPWNIAADFTIDMSFSKSDIEKMLAEYESDNNTGMNIEAVSGVIYDYTSGYPYLVSRICKLLDESIIGKCRFESKQQVWTENGVTEAVKELLKESNTLFDDIMKKLEDFHELRLMLQNILFNGKSYPYIPYNQSISVGTMFGFIKEEDNLAVISNRIFETLFYNLFLSEEMTQSEIYQAALLDKNQFIKSGYLDMDLVMEKFAEHFTDVYADKDQKFIEENGRRFFLLYLKPIINGVGNYYIEAQTRNMRRTDVIVDYQGRQYVIEIKIWHGEEYNRRGKEQLAGGMSCFIK